MYFILGNIWVEVRGNDLSFNSKTSRHFHSDGMILKEEKSEIICFLMLQKEKKQNTFI